MSKFVSCVLVNNPMNSLALFHRFSLPITPLSSYVISLPSHYGALLTPFPYPTEICLIEKDSGDCGAYQPMWYYDTQRRRCERFVYSGCGGNGNRFKNQEDCERRCQGVEERPQQPPTQSPTSQPGNAETTAAPVTGLGVLKSKT